MMTGSFVRVASAICFGVVGSMLAQSEAILVDLEDSSDDHMREELGVNEVTTPQIQKLLFDLDTFRPLPMELIENNARGASFPNRFQTALHFGTLVADGFVVVISEQKQDIQDLGRALLRQSRSLGVGDSLLRRSNAMIELGSNGNWMRLREELIGAQNDVEASMMALRDEELAHLISFGGWLRGFQLATTATEENYTPQRADGLKRLDVMNYFIDRLETLNPRVKQTPLVQLLISDMKKATAIVGRSEGRPPSMAEVAELRKLADQMVTAALSKDDDQNELLNIEG